MSTREWLADTRISYDTVAESYGDLVRDGLDGKPLLRGVLALFAELVKTNGPVADIGCGPGVLTAYLRDLGVEVFGIDISPAMLAIARRDNPGLNFSVGSMTELALTDRSVGGILASFSVIHIPDEHVPAVFAHFHRVLRPGGAALVGFHVGDRHKIKTEGYGGHPMKVHLHWRPVDRMAAWLREAGFTIEAEIVGNQDATAPAGFLVARRPAVTRP